jgi:hypothetical protein
MNGVEQILAHLSGCQRAFVLPPCPAEWLPTNSLRLADPSKMSTLHYTLNLVFHTLPQPPRYPLQSPYDAQSTSPQFLHVGAALRRLSSRGRTFIPDICDIPKTLPAVPAFCSPFLSARAKLSLFQRKHRDSTIGQPHPSRDVPIEFFRLPRCKKTFVCPPGFEWVDVRTSQHWNG